MIVVEGEESVPRSAAECVEDHIPAACKSFLDPGFPLNPGPHWLRQALADRPACAAKMLVEAQVVAGEHFGQKNDLPGVM